MEHYEEPMMDVEMLDGSDIVTKSSDQFGGNEGTIW